MKTCLFRCFHEGGEKYGPGDFPGQRKKNSQDKKGDRAYPAIPLLVLIAMVTFLFLEVSHGEICIRAG
jgi:hypothetical protein